ncbi:MAG: Rne/Rng family ribonuclease [Candidatus Neomarinimicrobiota bacterium]
MKKEIYINESMGETRIAILEDDQLVEVYVEKPDHQRMVGNIYFGKVENVIPGMQAAFVDIGYDINAFLPFSEIETSDYLAEAEEDLENSHSAKRRRKSNDRIEVDLKTGQDIYVQVIKEPFAGKGPRVTTEIALPGRLLVLVPSANYIGISKKIWDKYERRRLKRIVSNFKEQDFGVIVRTVAEGKSEEFLQNDYDSLIQNWNKLMNKAKRNQAPTLVYEDMETASSVVRDLFTPDIGKIVIDSRKLYHKLQNYLDDISPNLASRLERYKASVPLFEATGIEAEIDKVMRAKVWLKSGAYLIIEKTEAMVVVDVNSGRFIGKKEHEDNSLKINLEATREVARQLRLRDLSGLIVIDFIDMREEANKRKIYYELRKELRKDRAKVAVSPISEFGLLEMTRQRIRLSLLDSMSDGCPTCHGTGRVLSKEAMLTRIDHWIRRYRSNNRDLRLELRLSSTMADYLRDQKRKVMRGLMWQNLVHIRITEDNSVPIDEFRFISVKSGTDVTDQIGLEKERSHE